MEENKAPRRRAADNDHDKIFEILERMERAQVSIEKQLLARAHLDDQIGAIYKTVKGNGVKGLEERTAILEERETKRDRREWYITSVIVAQIIGIVLLAVMEFAGK